MSLKHEEKFFTKALIRPLRPFASVGFLLYLFLFFHNTREAFFLFSGSRFYFFADAQR